MKYALNIEIKLFNEDGDERGVLQREYSLADLSQIIASTDHAGKTAALHFEGVEKLDMTE